MSSNAVWLIIARISELPTSALLNVLVQTANKMALHTTKKQCCKHVPMIMNVHTTEEPWKQCFLCSASWGHIARTTRVESRSWVKSLKSVQWVLQVMLLSACSFIVLVVTVLFYSAYMAIIGVEDNFIFMSLMESASLVFCLFLHVVTLLVSICVFPVLFFFVNSVVSCACVCLQAVWVLRYSIACL
jgi:hypothetical protein